MNTALKSRGLLRFVGAQEVQDTEEFPEINGHDIIWDGIEHARDELKKERAALENLRDTLSAEKKQVASEFKQNSKRIQAEIAQLKRDQAMFEQKRGILEKGFHQLDVDRRKLAEERRLFDVKVKQLSAQPRPKKVYDDYFWEGVDEAAPAPRYNREANVYFIGVRDPIALRKRYKDLLKIFHPDNLNGDNDTLLMINKEYDILKDELG